MNKWKHVYILLALYEIVRVYFITTSQYQETQAALPLGWYANVPLMIIPFFLLFIHYKSYINLNIEESPFVQESNNSETMNLTKNLFLLQKIASCTGLLAFTIAYIQKNLNFVPLEGDNFLKSLPIVMIFFTIDVILCVTILLQQKNIDYSSEG